MIPSLRFRPNVAGILVRDDGKILIAERVQPAGAWQFPQGGIDEGEGAEEAFFREMQEELGLERQYYQVIDRKGPYRYVFEEGRKKRGYDGQEQTYFLAKLTGPEEAINIVTEHPEFQAIRWIFPHEFDLAWVPAFKREVYRAVLRDFFKISR